MALLVRRDLRELLKFLRGIYAARDLDAFRSHLISAIPKLIPSEITSYNEMNVQNATSVSWVDPPEILTPTVERVWEQHMHEHPCLIHYLRTGDRHARKISDFLTDRQFRGLGLYTEHFRPMRMAYVMGMFLPASPPLAIAVGLHRGRRDFTERERVLFSLVRPHIVQGYGNAKRVTRMREDQRLLSQAFDGLRRGVVVLAPDGEIRLATRHAQHWMTEYFGLQRREASRLPEDLQCWLRHEDDRLAQADDAPRPRGPLALKREGKRLVIRLLSASEDKILLFDEEVREPSGTSLASLGLTRREAEVLAWVAEGKANAEIGTILGSRPRTVAKHLEHIYQKLGIETRSAAVKLALTESSRV